MLKIARNDLEALKKQLDKQHSTSHLQRLIHCAAKCSLRKESCSQENCLRTFKLIFYAHDLEKRKELLKYPSLAEHAITYGCIKTFSFILSHYPPEKRQKYIDENKQSWIEKAILFQSRRDKEKITEEINQTTQEVMNMPQVNIIPAPNSI